MASKVKQHHNAYHRDDNRINELEEAKTINVEEVQKVREHMAMEEGKIELYREQVCLSCLLFFLKFQTHLSAFNSFP